MAIHEVMEQQTVTIAKAGIHASLNARCSVLGAANPVYGQYDRTRRPQENIGLPDSLLSRFDLLFIVLDQLDPQFDRLLSEHVITSHQYRRPGTIMEPEPLNTVSSLSLEDPEEQTLDTPVWLRGGPSTTSSSSANATSAGTGNSSEDILNKEFLRKYIYYAKNRIHPNLTDEAEELISTSYGQMRAKQTRKNLPITARTLETFIRISSSHAKLRLSDTIDVIDVEVAIELLNFVYFHEVHGGSGSNVTDTNVSSKSSSSQFRSLRENQENDPNQSNQSKKRNLQDSMENSQNSKRVDDGSSHVNDVAKRSQKIQESLNNLRETMGNDTISKNQLVQYLKDLSRQSSSSRDDNSPFTIVEIDAILQDLEAANKVC